ncbi:hypothetical protein G4228_006893 [Cervus hanglu yarkandensis]|nr:hypothetical protein G4228_006893 [Cervus hanglu yarkandensis]
MGEPQQVSALPPPPMQYIKEYTDENIQEGLAPKPPPPIKDSYMMFGNQFQCDDLIIRPLESQGIERLHPMQFDHKKELRKLNMSILINFLDLLDILIRSPGSIKREEKLEDLKLLFVHVHHLINEYRPHQARETLRVMMEVQKRQRLETAERFQKHLERVIEMIQNCLASLPDDLPHSEAGMRVKTEPMDADDSNNCTGQNEQQRENSDSLKGAYVSQVGQNADLPCTYSPATTENLVPVCWGRGPCPVFECYSLVLRTDGRNVTFQTSSRYLLKRDLHKGDVTLTIKNVTLADSGTYCCRIQFPGPMNDRKSNLELIIKPAKVTPAWTPWRDITTAFPRMLTTKGPVSETQTLETLRNKDQTEISTLATELQDMGATTTTGLYIGAGVSAGLALILISGGFILKCNLITLANLSPSGLANTVAEGRHPEENIYIIEENVYEVEDPFEYCWSVKSGQQS